MAHATCSIPGCDRPHNARGWCVNHYHRWRAHGDPLGVASPRTRNTCTVDGCNEYRVGRGWCSKHYTRWKRYGSPTARMPGEIVDGRRVCSGCRIDKATTEYGDATGPCRQCKAEYQRTPARRAKRAAWAAANADKMRDYMRMYAHLRRAQIARTAIHPISTEQLSHRMAYFGNRCWMCHGAFEHIDHVKPLSAGGPHILANMRPSCGACNRSKSAKWAGVAGVIELAA